MTFFHDAVYMQGQRIAMTDFAQGSPEWVFARLGLVTASRVIDVIARNSKGTAFLAGRENYMTELLIERFTGVPVEHFVSADMKWGSEYEPMARAAYESKCNTVVELVGFVPHPSIPETGASPDGFVGDDGLVEFKCPRSTSHIAMLLGGPMNNGYLAQMQFQLACCPSRAWCDYVSFDPRMPAPMQLYIRRILRVNTAIAEIEKLVAGFLVELRAKHHALCTQYMPVEAIYSSRTATP
jgi:hypothetical protein